MLLQYDVVLSFSLQAVLLLIHSLILDFDCVFSAIHFAVVPLSQLLQTRSHPEMVGDMLRVTLNFDLSKFLLCLSSQGRDLYALRTPKIKHVHLLVLLRAITDADDDDADNAGRHRADIAKNDVNLSADTCPT